MPPTTIIRVLFVLASQPKKIIQSKQIQRQSFSTVKSAVLQKKTLAQASAFYMNGVINDKTRLSLIVLLGDRVHITLR